MQEKGWIRIYRSLTEHWIWSDKPFSKGQAWIDLLLLANHTERKITVGNEIVDLKPGEFITSEVKLMERWGWGKTKVRTFLKQLENDNMIVKKPNRKQTTVSIVNYTVFQGSKTKTKPLPNREQTADKPPANTNKELKELEELKSVIGERYNTHAREVIHSPTLEEVKAFFSAESLSSNPDIFFNHYKALGWKNISDWKAKAREWSLKERKPEKTDYGSYDSDLFDSMLNTKD